VAQDPVALSGLVLDATARPARLVRSRSGRVPAQAINGIEIEFTAGFGADRPRSRPN
jgi:hypothetical protein